MRSQSQGLMATLLMFVPLLAVPIVAMFSVPWLAAKAKTEGIPVPEFSNADLMDSGVGQSGTARHSAEDLFAPVMERPLVDLRMSSDGPLQPPSATTVPNPHLQAASLVVSQENPGSDPFARLHDHGSSQPEAGSTNSYTPPSLPDSWTNKETPEVPGESARAEAPLPQEFPEPANEVKVVSNGNPFAAIGSDSPREELSEPQPPEPSITVGNNAFEDPMPGPRVNRDPRQFDASRELFLEEKPASSRPMHMAEVAPPSPPEETVESPTPRSPEESAPQREPLTWDTARARLDEYGITHKYLQPDAKGEMFHFRCAYSPGGNSRINRLFEAEAPTPLEAVGKVLDQLEAWTGRASANAN